MKTLAEATWTKYGDHHVTFPVFKVVRKQDDIYSLKIETVGQWLILPVLQADEKRFADTEVIGWACVAMESPDDAWTHRYECPGIFSSKKKARAWAEIYRLYPLNSLELFLEDPREYREVF